MIHHRQHEQKRIHSIDDSHFDLKFKVVAVQLE
ncbi:Uncharacterized protein APZ42_025820 [Daphnia magna]|uniref:Uncharacterized protein n=1 Tax=Daphnia magna TaxID=35525 RepID=A0A164SQQ0_9CRUS|nr:Uncharacterized protein APZ42_025820 [Daphnia magna]